MLFPPTLFHLSELKFPGVKKIGHYLKSNNSKIAECVFLLVLFLYSLYVRIQYPVYDLNDDIGRDIYVAKNFFSENNSSLFIRPNSTLFELPNTPTYFWFISLVYFITKTPWGILVVHSLLQASIPILSYFSLKKIATREAGIIAAIYTAVSPTLIEYSVHIKQFTLLPFFIALAFLGASYALTSKSYKATLLSIVSFAPALFLHNSSIPIFIGFSFVWLYISKDKMQAILNTIFILFIITNVFFLLSYQGDYELLEKFIEKIRTSDASNYSMSVGDKVSLVLTYFTATSVFFPLGAVLGAAGLAIKVLKRKSQNRRYLIVFVPVLFLVVSFFAPMSEFYASYFVAPFYIMFVYLLSFLIFSFPQKTHLILTWLVLIVMVIGMGMNKQITPQTSSKNPFKNFDHAGLIVDSIFTENGFEILVPLSVMSDYPQLANWFAPSIIVSSNKKLPLVDAHINENNVRFAGAEKGLLVCIDTKNDSFLTLNRCLADFQRHAETEVTLEKSFSSEGKTYYFYSYTNNFAPEKNL